MKQGLATLLLAGAGAASLVCSATTTAQGVRAQSSPPALSVTSTDRSAPHADQSTTDELNALLADPILARALVGVRIESLTDGRVLFERNPGALVMPASTMKIVTTAVAADRLGWDYRFTTTLEATGSTANGTLTGDLVVTSNGDPSIGSPDAATAPLFIEWIDALRAAGIRRVDGRLIGDDNAFDDETIGAGWAWDYLSAGYAAPSGALSFNENVAVVRITPATVAGMNAVVAIAPDGHGLTIDNRVRTTAPGTAAAVSLTRAPGTSTLTVSGTVSTGSGVLVRTTSVENPTQFFVSALAHAMAAAGISVRSGPWDIDDLPNPPTTSGRRLLARRESEPLSSLIGYAMKVSQNFYGETLLKAVGRTANGVGSAEAGRQIVRDRLAAWNLPMDSLVMYDGSGLSRYNYVSADLLVGILRHVWGDERLRGPFAAALPVGGHDGTLETRMRDGALDRHVQAKTGTIANVRALAGYADGTNGEKLAFAVIVNNFTAPAAQVDAIVERLLSAVVTTSKQPRLER